MDRIDAAFSDSSHALNGLPQERDVARLMRKADTFLRDSTATTASAGSPLVFQLAPTAESNGFTPLSAVGAAVPAGVTSPGGSPGGDFTSRDPWR